MLASPAFWALVTGLKERVAFFREGEMTSGCV